MSTPHDTLFHSTFGRARHARGLLQSRLPGGVAVVVDWMSLRPAPERIDSLDLRLHTADVVHCAELLLDLSIYFLLEHSSVLVRALRQKLLRYAVHLGRAGHVLVCLVVYHGSQPWREFQGSDARWLGLPVEARAALVALQARLDFLLIDLTAMAAADFRNPAYTPLAQLTLLCLRFLRGYDPAAALDAVDLWADLLRAVDRDPADGADAVEQIACYFLRTTDVVPEQLHAAFERVLQRPEDTIMSTAERLIREGEVRGEARGEVRGELRAMARKLLDLVARRFGPVPDVLVGKVQNATVPDLDRWFDRVLDAATLDELFA